MDPRFEDWVRKKYLNSGTAGSVLPRVRHLEAKFRDLDAKYNRDELKSVIATLEYSTGSGSPDASAPKIDGDAYDDLAALRSAVNRYVNFRLQLDRSRH